MEEIDKIDNDESLISSCVELVEVCATNLTFALLYFYLTNHGLCVFKFISRKWNITGRWYSACRRASLSVLHTVNIIAGDDLTPQIPWVSWRWRHYGRDGVSNHQRPDCLLNRLFRRTSKETPKIRVTDLVRGIDRWLVDSLRKVSVTRKMFPFDDVIMIISQITDLVCPLYMCDMAFIEPMHCNKHNII